MTDETNPVAAAMQATIDSMAAAGASGDHATIKQGESLKYDSATDTLTGTPVPSRIPDDGRDVHHEAAQIHSRVNALQAQLDEATFDPATGTKTYKVSDPTLREQLASQLERAKLSAGHDIECLNALTAQRAADRIASEARSNELLAIQAFSNGDPARAAEMKAALLRAEANAAAEAIVEARRVGIKHGAR